MFRMPGRSHKGPLPPMTEEENETAARLRSHVQVLAEDIGERNIFRYRALDAAAEYIEQAFRGLGYTTAHEEFKVHGKIVRNVEALLHTEGSSDDIVLIGAHYDSVAGSPGANDNASGTAGMLELSRLLRNERLDRSVRFVAFVNEEPPFFRTQYMGSRVSARNARLRGKKITAMLSLETIGSYSSTIGSQKYPFPFGLFYPPIGDFIGFVGNMASRTLVHECIASFRRHTEFPSEGLAAPGWIMGIGWSDHWAFWKEGYRAVMVTDTALFRYPHYHLGSDTLDKLDFASTARVVAGLKRTACDLARF